MEPRNYLIEKLSGEMMESSGIDNSLFKKYDVKRGLRNEDGTGVLVGLTNIGNVVGYERGEDGSLIPIDGKLFLRGYEIADIVKVDLDMFRKTINENMPLKKSVLLHIIEMEGHNIMNILARSVLEFYTFDRTPDDTSKENLMRQSIILMSKFPTIIAYAYNMLRHGEQGRSLHIRHPQKNLSFAENFLFMLKGSYTPLEAKTLDLLLILHSEHGGGNNSTFTVRVTSSTGTDTYSSIAAGIGSLKGPKHGGANLKVSEMLRYLKSSVENWKDEGIIAKHLEGILNGEELDGQGLIYGIGHAVYTLSDPRAVLLKKLAGKLAEEKGRVEEYEFLQRIEKVAIETVYKVKGRGKTLCPNVDFYSGFVYDLIGIPQDIYTPLFAMSRIVGWCAHRNEELNFKGRRIIRPAYRCVTDERAYVLISDRR